MSYEVVLQGKRILIRFENREHDLESPNVWTRSAEAIVDFACDGSIVCIEMAHERLQMSAGLLEQAASHDELEYSWSSETGLGLLRFSDANAPDSAPMNAELSVHIDGLFVEIKLTPECGELPWVVRQGQFG